MKHRFVDCDAKTTTHIYLYRGVYYLINIWKLQSRYEIINDGVKIAERSNSYGTFDEFIYTEGNELAALYMPVRADERSYNEGLLTLIKQEYSTRLIHEPGCFLRTISCGYGGKFVSVTNYYPWSRHTSFSLEYYHEVGN